MNLGIFNIQDRSSFFKHVQRWAAGWASGYDNTLTRYRMHSKASAEGYKAAAGCCKVSAKLHFKPVEVVRRTSNGSRLVSCLIVPVVINKQLWHTGRWWGEARGLTLINGQQRACVLATKDTVKGATEKALLTSRRANAVWSCNMKLFKKYWGGGVPQKQKGKNKGQSL